MRDSDSFISRMLEETFATNRNFRSQASLALSCRHVPELMCFRLAIGDTEIDLPQNWSFFSNLLWAMQEGQELTISIDRENDQDSLYSVLRNLIGDTKKLIFKVQDGNFALLVEDLAQDGQDENISAAA